MTTVPLQCTCGKVKGEARQVSAQSGNRLVCYCDDCQAFARFLGNENAIMDVYGGTDIYQMPQAHLTVHDGADQIRCMRLSPKGMYRWYTACCRTPIGNTMGRGVPFIGSIHNFMHHDKGRDEDLGPSRASVFVKFAKTDDPDKLKTGNLFLLLLRAVRKLLVWKIQGLDQPSSFFDKEGNPVSAPEVLLP